MESDEVINLQVTSTYEQCDYDAVKLEVVLHSEPETAEGLTDCRKEKYTHELSRSQGAHSHYRTTHPAHRGHSRIHKWFVSSLTGLP